MGSRYAIHPTQIAQWRKHLVEGAATVFARGAGESQVDQQSLIDDLYQQLGQAHVELAWLKKSVPPKPRHVLSRIGVRIERKFALDVSAG